MLMSAAEYRESLRRYRPVVYVNGRRVADVAGEPSLASGVTDSSLRHDEIAAD
jgi:4-hydroxybutyryl-CoA dehydratase / vinylacetyl-CoA-Delta-isomerase